MQPTYGEAGAYLQPVFDQAQAALQTQVPAIQNLYAALLQGLQTQGAAQTQGVVNSANRRGVGRTMLASDVQNQLGQELALQGGQLGVQQAQDIAGVQQAAGQLGVQRVGRISDLADSLLQAHLARVKSGTERENIERTAQMKMQEAGRDYEISRISSERRKAEEAAERAASKSAKALTTSQALLTVSQLWQPGKDGYVNPKQWNELRKAFMEAGYDGGSFDSEFGALINPKHQFRDSKMLKYTGVGLKD